LLIEAQRMDLIQDTPIPLVTEILAICLKVLIRSASFSQWGFSTTYHSIFFWTFSAKGLLHQALKNSPPNKVEFSC